MHYLPVLMAGDQGVGSSWERLWGLVPDGIKIALGVIGVGLAVGSVIWWLIKRGRQGGSGMSGFPFWLVIGGGILTIAGTAGGVLASGVEAIVNAILVLFSLGVKWFG